MNAAAPPMSPAEFEANGYALPRLLPTGEWAALHKFIYTTGLVVGIDATGFRTRFCYATSFDAAIALLEWDGQGDPPGPWIKEKGRVERSNPKRFGGIPIVVEERHEHTR